MKKKILFGAFCAAVLTTATFVACNSTDEPVADSAINPVTVPTSGFDGFMASVDSLNNVYSLQSRSNAVVFADGGDFSPIDTRLNRNKMVSYADQVGSCVGDVAAVTLGIAAVTTTGGTAVGVTAVIFSQFGSTWFSHYYSAVAKLATKCWGYSVSLPKLNSNTSIQCSKDGKSFLDSIGYRHNKLMVDLEKYDQKYLTLNILNRDVQNQFYLDFAKEMKILYPEFDGIELSDEGRDALISSAIDVLAIAQKNISGQNYYKNYVDEINVLLTTKYKISKEDARVLKDYASNLSYQFDKLNEREFKVYVNDLNTIINNSDLNDQQKSSIRSVSQISVNSYLCWKD